MNKLLGTVVHFYIKMSFHINLKDASARCGGMV